MKTIGVLGLGIIGSVWTNHYEAAGVLGGCWSRSGNTGSRGKFLASPGAVAEACDLLHIVVADPAAVDAILAKLAPKLKSRHLVIQSSTIDPAASGKFQARVEARGARYLEAPFTGSKPGAEQRQLVFYLGGAPEARDEAEPYLKLLSELRLAVGRPEQAATLKLAMNLQIAAQLQALSEAVTLARLKGIDDDVFFQALERNAAWSGVARLKVPKLRARDFTAQFSVKHMHKDLRLALETAGPGLLPVGETVRARLKAAEAAGYGDEDFCALIKLLDEPAPAALAID